MPGCECQEPYCSWYNVLVRNDGELGAMVEKVKVVGRYLSESECAMTTEVMS